VLSQPAGDINACWGFSCAAFMMNKGDFFVDICSSVIFLKMFSFNNKKPISAHLDEKIWGSGRLKKIDHYFSADSINIFITLPAN